MTIPAFAQRDPDARGYYGAYGGRFVPETLVAPVAELEAAYFEARQDPAFIAEFGAPVGHHFGAAAQLWRAADAAVRGAPPERDARRCPYLPQARRSRPHRRAQDQQRAGPG